MPRKNARKVVSRKSAPKIPVYIPAPQEDVPLTIPEACAFFGGSRPIDVSTYYRGVKTGRYPKPFRLGSNAVRVMRSACEEARKQLAAL